jgi:hypothetical protein
MQEEKKTKQKRNKTLQKINHVPYHNLLHKENKKKINKLWCSQNETKTKPTTAKNPKPKQTQRKNKNNNLKQTNKQNFFLTCLTMKMFPYTSSCRIVAKIWKLHPFLNSGDHDPTSFHYLYITN